MEQRIFSILVDNSSGVLNRISGMFSRRGYNIDSLTVGVTADPRYSRMTIVSSGDEQILEQITKQLEKMVDVRDLKVLHPDNSVNRELILVKIKVDADQRQSIMSLVEVFRAKIVDIGVDSMMVELTGAKNKLQAFVSLLDGYEILELARTGITGLSRGTDDVRILR